MVATATEIRLSSVAEMQKHAGALLVQHWREVATDKQLMKLAPDWGKYNAMEEAGILLAVAAWDEDQMVGYTAGTILHHLHYEDLVYYQNDVLFVADSHRKTGVGARLVAQTGKEAKLRGAKAWTFHVKEGSSGHRMFAASKRFRVQDIVYLGKL